jgi:hypothetical protein
MTLTQGTIAERIDKMRAPDMRGRLIADEEILVTTGVGGPISGLIVQETPDHPELAHYCGRTLGEIAAAEGKHHIEVMLDIGIAGSLKVLFRTNELSSTDHKKVGELVRNQHIMPGISDGGAHTKFFTGGSFTTDMITWLVRETGELTLEQAHYRLSYLPAQAAGFLDRGFLREGAPADIVVYDFENLKRVPEVDYEVAYDFPGQRVATHPARRGLSLDPGERRGDLQGRCLHPGHARAAAAFESLAVRRGGRATRQRRLSRRPGHARLDGLSRASPRRDCRDRRRRWRCVRSFPPTPLRAAWPAASVSGTR